MVSRTSNEGRAYGIKERAGAYLRLPGLLLLLMKGVMVLYFGLAGIALGVLYSLGPVRLSALGIGETAVAIAFGVIPVAGAAWLQGAALNVDLLIFSVPISLWVGAILLINEVPDIGADGATGKRTLPVRIGLGGTAAVYVAMNIAAFAAIAWLTYAGALPLLAPLAPLALLALAIAPFIVAAALVLVSGLWSMALTNGFINAGWVWLKLIMGILVFKGVLLSIQGPVEGEAKLSAAVLAGDADPGLLGMRIGEEWGVLWVMMAISIANIVLAIWRPRFSKEHRKARAAAKRAAKSLPTAAGS